MITQGTIMLAAGVLGFAICAGSLCFLPRTFSRQREELLAEIENQDKKRDGKEKGKGE